MPAMLRALGFGRMASLPAGICSDRVYSVLRAVIGLVVISRGLNLGIPFLSPVMESRLADAG